MGVKHCVIVGLVISDYGRGREEEGGSGGEGGGGRGMVWREGGR